MSLPPVTVHIKRKATDEPVDFLRVHESTGKRQRRATDFVFSRQQTPEVGNDSATPSPAPQGVRRIKQIHRAASSQSLRTSSTQATIQTDLAREQSSGQLGAVPAGGLAKDGGQQTITPSTDSVESHQSLSGNDATPTSVQNAPPRRFHISRSATPTNPLGPFSSGIRKKPTLFTERRPVRPLSRDGLPRSPDGQATSEVAPAEQSRPQKKPGLAARNTSGQVKDASPTRSAQLVAPVSARNVRLPSGAMMAWDVNSEQLAAEMQAYTLQEIGRSLAESEATKPGFKPSAPASYLKSKESRFKPKTPSLRYQERHPEDAIQRGSEMDIDEPYLEDDMDEDSDYIIDTYIRVPADVLESSDDQKNFGLLVLESQPDIDEFYRDDDESEEEDDEEEEDENAENHYSADYPDEELESDDEFDRNPYLYRTHNASDLEEFDEDDATFSDDEATTYPWAKKPWMTKPTKARVASDEDEDDV